MTDAELITKAASVIRRHAKMEKRAWSMPPIDDDFKETSLPSMPKTFYPGKGAPEFKAPSNMLTGLGRTFWGAQKAYNPILQGPLALIHNSDPSRPSGFGGTFRNFANAASTGFADPTANKNLLTSIPGYTAARSLLTGSGWRDALSREYNSSNPIWSAMRANRAYGHMDMTQTMPAWSKDPKSILNQMYQQGAQGAKMVDEQGPAVY